MTCCFEPPLPAALSGEACTAARACVSALANQEHHHKHPRAPQASVGQHGGCLSCRCCRVLSRTCLACPLRLPSYHPHDTTPPLSPCLQHPHRRHHAAQVAPVAGRPAAPPIVDVQRLPDWGTSTDAVQELQEHLILMFSHQARARHSRREVCVRRRHCAKGQPLLPAPCLLASRSLLLPQVRPPCRCYPLVMPSYNALSNTHSCERLPPTAWQELEYKSRGGGPGQMPPLFEVKESLQALFALFTQQARLGCWAATQATSWCAGVLCCAFVLRCCAVLWLRGCLSRRP